MADDNQIPSWNDDGPGHTGPPTSETPVLSNQPTFNTHPATPPKGKNRGCIIAVVVTLVILFVAIAVIVGGIIWGINRAGDEINNAVENNDVEQIIRDFTSTTVPGNPVVPTPSQITLDEYNKVTTGMSYQQVVDTIGGPEINCTSAAGANICTWSGSGVGAAIITLDAPKPDGKVVAKTEYGLN